MNTKHPLQLGTSADAASASQGPDRTRAAEKARVSPALLPMEQEELFWGEGRNFKKTKEGSCVPVFLMPLSAALDQA